jgi:hypothetical protein
VTGKDYQPGLDSLKWVSRSCVAVL